MIGEPYRWQCEAERCYRQRDRAGRWHAHGRDMGTDDPGAGHRYHPECHPRPTIGWQDWCVECGRVCNGGALTTAPVAPAAACACHHRCLAWSAMGPDALQCRVAARCGEPHAHDFRYHLDEPTEAAPMG